MTWKLSRLDNQMDKGVPWIVIFRFPATSRGICEQSEDLEQTVPVNDVVCSEAHFEGVPGAGGRHVVRRAGYVV